MKTFEEYKKAMKLLIKESENDAESPHIKADTLLTDILKDVSNGAEIMPEQVEILIDLYNEVEKWYA